MRKFFLVLFISILSILLSGCNDYIEIHEITFVASIGLDYDIDTLEYEVTFYIINNLNFSHIALGTAEPSTLGFTAIGRGPSIADAIEKIDSNSDIILDLHHVKTVIFTERFFSGHNVIVAYELFKNSPHHYPTFEIFVTSDKLADIYQVQNMSDITAFYTIITGKKVNHTHQVATYFDLANDILLPKRFYKYPILSVNKDVFKKEKEFYITLEVSGYGFLKNDLALSMYSFKNLDGMNYINNFESVPLKIENTTIYLKEYNIEKHLDKDILVVNIDMEASITSNPDHLTEEQIKQMLANSVQTKLEDMRKQLAEDNVDIFNVMYLNDIKGSKMADLATFYVKTDYNFTVYIK